MLALVERRRRRSRRADRRAHPRRVADEPGPAAADLSAGIVSLPAPRHAPGRAAAPRRRRDVLGQVARQGAHVRLLGLDRLRAVAPRRPPSATCAPGSSTPSTRSPARSTPRTATRTRTPSASPATPPSSAARSACREERLELLRTAGVLHDVGKIGIPDAVLLKPGKLDARRVRRHAPPLRARPRHHRRRRPGGDRRPGSCTCTSASTAAATRTASPARRSRSRAGSCTAPTRSRR